MAKFSGAKVIATSSSDEKLKLAKANGADETIIYSLANWSEKVKEVNNGKGVEIAFKMVGGDVYNQTIKSLAQGGHLIIYGCASGVQGQIDPEHFVDENINQSGFKLAFYITTKTQVWQEALGTVIGLIAQGMLKVETSNIFTLADVKKAHQQIEVRQTTGKVVLMP